MMNANLTINYDDIIGKIDPRLWGSFTEQLGRSIYTGIYQPGHPQADSNGFRKDVIEAILKLKVPLIRYPGGNFVSGYNWEDGIGPKDQRPRRLDLAWKSIETNEFGLHEFINWCRLVNAQPDMAINLGTRGIDAARNLIEYCNFSKGTYWSDLRRKNGAEEPFNIKVWSLGNEMDGDWQIGHKTAEEYGRLAHETAKAMRIVDPNIELIASGSSLHNMPTFGKWEETILDHVYDDIDYLSLHQYYDDYDHDIAKFLASSEDFDSFINDVIAICDAVKARKHSNKIINLAMDEWNVWYHSKETDAQQKPWQQAPTLLEDHYTFADALVVGGLAITLMKHADRVKIGCLAQLVNVIAPIMTRPSGEPSVWYQSIFYPFMQVSNLGQGLSLKVKKEVKAYQINNRDIPYVDAAAVYNSKKQEIVLFIENKSSDSINLNCSFNNFDIQKLLTSTTFSGYNLDLTNEQQVMKLRTSKTTSLEDDCLRAQLEPYSWNVARIKVEV
ncbi:Alpha-N-arabinofuranosidase 1 [Bombilactobacillus mellis]|uniref:non-reducing end alpha-L-arabinofuranosidase n=2 Tax=Bombilactobacillus mellis TaxID=1218508 RepID=A0A0F4KYM9_9LACO|nr:Alpha-N-arabinofuranosidase 1 [Bombilactobacillus mellis]